MLQTRIRLGLENEAEPGHICKLDLENVTLEQNPPWPQLNRLDVSFDAVVWLQLGEGEVLENKNLPPKEKGDENIWYFHLCIARYLLVIRETVPSEVKK